MDVEDRQLGEQRLADQLAEGADDDRLAAAPRGSARSAASVVDVARPAAARSPAPRAASATGGGCDACGRGPGGRSGGVTTSAGRCGESAEPPQDGRGEVGGAEVDGPHASVRGSRSSSLVARPRPRPAGCSCRPRAAPAARPCAARAAVRSRIRTPSRWSISCWSTRASRPEASIAIGSPSTSRPLTRACSGRSTSIETRGRLRQPSSAIAELVGEPLDLRVDQRRRLAVGAGLEDEQPAQHAELGGGEADPHARRA